MTDEELLDKTTLALLVEVGELANATCCFKHWSVKGPESRERLLDEYSDILHFYLSIGNQIDIKESEFEIPTFEEKTSNKMLTTLFILTNDLISKLFLSAGSSVDNMIVPIEFIYSILLDRIVMIGESLEFTEEEIEQAYLKKHEENYRRQREGY